MYAVIICVDGSSDILDEVENLFLMNDYSTIDFLSQWDYGVESEYDLVEDIERKRFHVYDVKDDYILESFPAMEWYTLYRKVEN